MRVTLQLVMESDAGHEETSTDVITLDKNHQRIEHRGVPLAASPHLLSPLQRHRLQPHVDPLRDTGSTCPECGTPLKLKARASRSFRTLFGTFQFERPRLEHCGGKRRTTSSCRPFSALRPEAVAPELLSMAATWSSLVSYGMSLAALTDLLPLAVTLEVKSGRYDTRKVAKRLAAERGDEQPGFIEGSPSAWALLPRLDRTCKVGSDGGDVRNGFAQQPHCEVIVGKSLRSLREEEDDQAPSSKRCGCVQTLDTKPQRRLDEVSHS